MTQMSPLCVDDRNEWPLDSMGLQSDVTKRHREEFTSPPREGAYIHGLYMEGARWDTQVHPLLCDCHGLKKIVLACVLWGGCARKIKKPPTLIHKNLVENSSLTHYF